MKKLIVLILFVSFCFTNLQCSKEKENQPPSVIDLIFPTQNLLCIDNNIIFNWSEATDPENNALEYRFVVSKDRQFTDIVENRTITGTQLTLSLSRGTAYYWKVEALDIDNDLGTFSETFAFYTKGDGVQNYVPFTAALTSPENNSQVTAGSVNLTWNAADPNAEDILTYELYFGEDENPTKIEGALTEKSYSVSVLAGKTYYWKINVMDQTGAKSIGKIFSFRVN